MEVKAQGKNIRISPTKVRDIAKGLKGKNAIESSEYLKYISRSGANVVKKVLDSAIANAENNDSLKGDALTISQAFVDEGPKYKRYRPRSRGMAAPIFRRTSHVTIVVEGEEKVKRIKKTKEEEEGMKVEMAEETKQQNNLITEKQETKKEVKKEEAVEEVRAEKAEKVEKKEIKKGEVKEEKTEKSQHAVDKPKAEKPSLKDLAQDREKKATKEEKLEKKEEGFKADKKGAKQDQGGGWRRFFRRKTG